MEYTTNSCTSTNILLSVVLQGRNDSYMGNFDFRLATNINKFAQDIFQLNSEKDVEIVLVDWGSEIPLTEVLKLTDKAKSLLRVIRVSPEIAAKYNRDSPYSCVHPVNVGIRHAKGTYILFCDADTYTPLETLRNLLTLIKSGFINGISLRELFLMGSRYHIPKSFHASSPSLDEIDRYVTENCDTLVHDKVDLVNFLGTATGYLFTRDMLFECRGFDERYIYWGWWDIDLFHRLKTKYNAFDLEDFNMPFFHLEHYSDSKYRNMEAENPRKLNPTIMPRSFAPNDENWGLSDENIQTIRLTASSQNNSSHLSDSELNQIIPPEIKNDEFYFLIQKIAREEHIKTVLEIGSSAGGGSTEAFVTGLRENPDKPLLFCMEISKPRFQALRETYRNDSFVKCYNVSSVSIEDFPSEEAVSAFYQTTKTSLNNYPLDQVIGWLQQDIEYVKNSGVPSDGIERVKQSNNILNFDLVLIDGSEFTGTSELNKIYGAKFIMLDDINAFKNYDNYQRLVNDPNYVLVKENWSTRNGFAVFRYDDSGFPMHFFTIVLNGEPFIRYHINVLKQLPFKWHWHIVEGVAELKHDTAWSVPLGGRVTDTLHNRGLSNDGTTEYLDELASKYSENITIYRKPRGVLWDGKLEMVSAPLPKINDECILHEIDADELWTFSQLYEIRQMFLENQTKTAAYYWCHFFVGENLVTTQKNAYSKNPSYEWIRTWKFKPGHRWLSHEPPNLCKQTEDGRWEDLAKINPFMHDETESRDLVFQHYAYVTEKQLEFKEIYYGYKDAVKHWKLLQELSSFPAYLRDYLPWVNDLQQANTLQSQNISPIARQDIKGQWVFNYYQKSIGTTNKAITQSTNLVSQHGHFEKILIDGVIFQLQKNRPVGIYRTWKTLLTKLSESRLAEKIVLLDRAATAPFIPGIKTIQIREYIQNDFEADSLYLEDICREENAALFISTYYTYPENSHSALMLHDMIPEITGTFNLIESQWRAKAKAIEKAFAYFSVSQSTLNDFRKLFPQFSNRKTYLTLNAAGSFKSNTSAEIEGFKKKHNIQKPYFLLIGNLLLYKNAILFFRAFSLLENKADYEILCVGAEEKELNNFFAPYTCGMPCHMLFLNDEDLSKAYSGAIALVYPSRYEGFGLPVLEAMKSGCPVITCRNSSLPEVAGDAALYVDEVDVAQMRDALIKIQQPDIRNELIRKGLENVKRFSWKETGRKLVAAIQEILEDIKGVPLNSSDPSDTPGRLMYLLTKCPGWKQLYPVMVNLEMTYTESRTYNDSLVEKDESIVANMDSEIFNLLRRSLPLIEEKNYLMYYFYGLALEKQNYLPDAYNAYKIAVECWQANHVWRPAYLAADVAQRLDNLELAKQLLTSIVLVEYPAYAEAQNKLRIINDKLKTRTAGNIPEQRGKEYVRVEPSGESKLTYDKKGFKVSAIISTHNSERFIRGCIDDLVNQTLYKKGELELIVVDSGSEQNERSVIEEFRGKYKNIRYIRTEERESIYKAWNRGIKAASGEYLTNANTDDRHRNDALEVMADLLDRNQDIGLVYADQIITDRENETFENHTYRSVWRWPSYSRELLTLGCFIGPQPMWRKALHDTFGSFDESFEVCGDWEFWLRIAESTRMLHIPEFLGLYFSSSHSAERRNPGQKTKEDTFILLKYMQKYFTTMEDVDRGLLTVRQLQQEAGNSDAYSYLVEDLLEIKSVFMNGKSFNQLPLKAGGLPISAEEEKNNPGI